MFWFLGAPPLRGRFGPIDPKSSSQSRTWTPNLHRHEVNPLIAETGGMTSTWWTYFLPEESLRCRPMTQQGLSPTAIAPWGTSPVQPCQCRVPLYQVSCFLKRAVGLLKPLQGPSRLKTSFKTEGTWKWVFRLRTKVLKYLLDIYMGKR